MFNKKKAYVMGFIKLDCDPNFNEVEYADYTKVRGYDMISTEYLLFKFYPYYSGDVLDSTMPSLSPLRFRRVKRRKFKKV